MLIIVIYCTYPKPKEPSETHAWGHIIHKLTIGIHFTGFLIIILVGIRTRNQTNEKYHHIILISNLDSGVQIFFLFIFCFYDSLLPQGAPRLFSLYMNVCKNDWSLVFFLWFATREFIHSGDLLSLKTELKVISMYWNKDDSLFGTPWLVIMFIYSGCIKIQVFAARCIWQMGKVQRMKYVRGN